MNKEWKNKEKVVMQAGGLCSTRRSEIVTTKRRIVMDASGNVKQVNNYYPSGTLMAERRTDQGVQPYKFGGKELDRTFGLDFYDFDARQFDPTLMRFTRPDPLAGKYYRISPYVYCMNNPVKYIDKDGRDPGDVFKTKDDAARDWGVYYNGASILNKREYASSIYQTKSGYSYSVANEGGTDGAKPSAPPKSEKWVATIHSHGNYLKGYVDKDTGFDANNNFSVDDTDAADRNARIFGADNAESYLATPSGVMLKYSSSNGVSKLDPQPNMASDREDPNRANEINPQINPNLKYNPSEDKEPKSKFFNQ